MIFRKSKANG